jgi:hypothetical protein
LIDPFGHEPLKTESRSPPLQNPFCERNPTLSPDVVYTDNIIDVLTPVGGRTVGRAAFAKIMQTIAQKWEHLAFRIGPVTASTNRSNEVHCQIEFLIRHKPTGEELYGKNRFVACIKDGYIKSIDIFHDAPMFAAFLKLIGSAR